MDQLQNLPDKSDNVMNMSAFLIKHARFISVSEIFAKTYPSFKNYVTNVFDL